MALRVVISYDISADRVRARVAAILSAWGERIQKSVFACVADPDEIAEIMMRVDGLIDPRTDSVHLFHQCRDCHERAQLLGQAESFERPLYWVV